jgi:hypothetical protein
MDGAYVDLRGVRTWLPGVLVAPDNARASLFERKLYVMHTSERGLAPSDLATIRCRTLVMAGDDDEMPIEHTLELYRSLPTRRARARPRHVTWLSRREAAHLQCIAARLPHSRFGPHVCADSSRLRTSTCHVEFTVKKV